LPEGTALAGEGALLAALERSRTGTMRDIVATIQGEQDEVIRAPMAGVLVVQGAPGTGKTAVALHRAAYLLFTHRARLERQGVLIVGPNRLFLHYIDQVLPALGETGADLVTIESLIPDVTVTAVDTPIAARLKGDPRMARVIGRVLTSYQRAPDHDLVVKYEGHKLRVSRARLAALVRIAKRNRKSHNRRRAMLHVILTKDLLNAYLRAERKIDAMLPVTIDRKEVARELRTDAALVAMLDRMWPSLTPARVLEDLWSSPELLESVAGRMLKPAERVTLFREPGSGWTHGDIPLLDELLVRTGAVRRRAKLRDDDETDELQTYGHILVDEVQDLSPMALRMIARRSRSGWMTVVGDLAQSVGSWTPSSWDDIVRHLKPRFGWERRELTINYRTPAEIMRLAERVRLSTAPGLRPANAVRESGAEPAFVRTDDVIATVARAARAELDAIEGGTVAVIGPRALLSELGDELSVPVVSSEDPNARLVAGITLADADTVKGLEFDSVVLVEPSRLVGEHAQGLRALYVALTRATKRLTVVHASDLPRALAPRSSSLG
ncbi:MAG: UvrD-helicase domain-containing protein, partial [Actinomycetota bacterium]